MNGDEDENNTDPYSQLHFTMNNDGDAKKQNIDILNITSQEG
jgi:hypothetical protein